MKQRMLSFVLALCLCLSLLSAAHVFQEDTLPQKEPSLQAQVIAEKYISRPAFHDNTVPTPAQVYHAMTVLKDQEAYKEGADWTDDEPYSDSKGYYYWKGGTLDGKNIVAVGCVAFAFILSDTAFGSLPARMYGTGEFQFEDIKAGDILRMNTDTHTVIVLEVNEAGVVVAEGNISTGDHTGKVHWGRAISKDVVMNDTSHYITRYPEGYIPPDDPDANTSIGSGSLNGGLTWNLTKAGTLTISGRGAMPDFSGPAEQPWYDYRSQIRKVIIGDGVTSIGSCAFGDCGVLSAEIASSVTTIGNSAFRGSSIISADIPSSVKTIGDSAFRECQNLSSTTISEGVETIEQNAFRACISLASIDLPASIGEVGASAFLECTAMTSATFIPGNRQVKIGDNLFTRCYYLMNVTLPTSIDRIGDGMFQNCGMLAGVEIPQGTESIGASSFASSGVTTVIIPDSVTTIGIAAFSNCPLKDIYFTGTETQWNSISKIGDTESIAKATIHYNYIPEENPGDNEPGDSKPDGSKPGDNTSDNNKPGGDEPGENTPDSNKPGGNEPGNNQPDSSNPGENKPGNNQPDSSNPDENKPGNNQPDNSRPGDNKPGNGNAEQESQPDTGIPFIKGENGKSGWDAIRAEEETVVEGSVIHVNMNNASVVPGDIFDSIKGRDITITFDMGNGILWSVDGKSITAEQVNDIDLSVRTGTNAIPADIINPVAGESYRLQLSLSHEGEFGFTAVLSINLSKGNAGRTAVLYYYNPNAKALELMCKEKIAEDGTVGLTFTHASEYLITVDNVTDTGTGTDTENKNITSDTRMKAPETGDRDHERLWGIMMAGALALIIGTTFQEKRKRQ